MTDHGAPHILMVEDQVELAEIIGDYLRAEHYRVSLRERGDGVVELVRQQPPDLILLDLMLPGVNGLTICREIRRFSEVPIIMVTARVEEIDRLLGLEIGADDYICKPARPREVVARVKAVLRRYRPEPQAPGGRLALDDTALVASLDGQVLDLTVAEFRLLKLLHERPGRVFSRAQLLEAIYDDGRVVGDRSIDTHVKNIRRKLAAVIGAGEGPVIHSIYGVGYKLEEGTGTA